MGNDITSPRADLCKGALRDSRAPALYEDLVTNFGLTKRKVDKGYERIMRPKGAPAYLKQVVSNGCADAPEAYDKAIEIAEQEEDANRERLRAAANAGGRFQLVSPFQDRLIEKHEMQISWLFRGPRASAVYPRILRQLDRVVHSVKARGIGPSDKGWERALGIALFEYIKAPKEEGGLGIVFDRADRDPTKDVVEVIEAGKATCIEFAFLYRALARQVGLDARPIEVYTDEWGKTMDHAAVGIECRDGPPLLLDIRTGGKLHPKQKWAFAPKRHILTMDEAARAKYNAPPGSTDVPLELKLRRYERAIEYSQDYYLARHARAYLEFVERHDYRAALSEALKGLKDFPDYAPLHYSVSRIYEALGKKRLADAACATYKRLSGKPICVE